jgi:hypothetical protein
MGPWVGNRTFSPILAVPLNTVLVISLCIHILLNLCKFTTIPVIFSLMYTRYTFKNAVVEKINNL